MAMLKHILLLVLINIVVCSAASPSSIPKRELRRVAMLYCVASDSASNQQLKAAMDYVCRHGVDCRKIQPGQSCYNPNNLNFHTSVVINSYFRNHSGQQFYCTGDGPLRGVGELIFTNPSQGSCQFD